MSSFGSTQSGSQRSVSSPTSEASSCCREWAQATAVALATDYGSKAAGGAEVSSSCREFAELPLPRCVMDSEDSRYHFDVIHPRLLRAVEEKSLPLVRADFASAAERTAAINSIVRAHDQLHLSTATLFLSVRILDQELLGLRRPSYPCRVLLSASALLVASKFEDEPAPLMADIASAFGDAFTINQLRCSEAALLNSSGFRLHRVTVEHHLKAMRYFAVDGNVRLQQTMLFVAEVSLFCGVSSQWPPSLHAAAIAQISCRLEQLPTPDCIQEYWGAIGKDCGRVALQKGIQSQMWSLLLRCQDSPLSGRATLEKFSHGGFSGIAVQATAAAVAAEYGSKAAGLSQVSIQPPEGACYVGLRTWLRSEMSIAAEGLQRFDKA